MLSDTMMLGGGRKAAYSIENSLLFRGGQKLSRTWGGPTSQYVWTFRVLVRRAALGLQQALFGATNSNNLTTALFFSASDQLSVVRSDVVVATSPGTYRDVTGWYDVLLSSDGSTVRGYVNGVQVLAYAGTLTSINTPLIHEIGERNWGGTYFNGSMAEPCFIDGVALMPSSFGEIDPVTNSWRPKRNTGITWGANGFYLGKPWNSTSLGTDCSGQGNHWTPSGFSVSDVLNDSPTNVYAVFNPLDRRSYATAGLSSGNLTLNAASNGAVGTIYAHSGQHVFEVGLIGHGAGALLFAGIVNDDMTANLVYVQRGYASTGVYWRDGVSLGTLGAAWTTDDTIRVEVDIDADTISFFKNGALQFTVADQGLSGERWTPFFCASSSANLSSVTINTGQRAWANTPSAGFKAWSTAGLSTPVSAAAKQPWKYYSCQKIVHNGSGTAVTLGWDAVATDWLVRIKSLGSDDWHYLDTKRGLDKVLAGNSARIEDTNAAMVTNRTASGFVLGSGLAAATYLVEAWRVAPEAGFDIVLQDTLDASTQTVLHNNGVAPKFVVGKIRNLSDHWYAYHASVGAGSYLKLNSTDGAAVYANMWNNTAPTATQVTLGSSWRNASTKAVFYIWSEVPGFSVFWSYTGNGSADGPFNWLGFTPGEVMFKQTNTSSDWTVYDIARSPSNPAVRQSWANSNGEENSKSANAVDLLCGGVKIRNTLTSMNTNGGTYITAAWAAHPLGAKRVTSATAR